MEPSYDTLFFYEVGQWWDYIWLVLITLLLAGTAWLLQRSKAAVAVIFVIAPVLLTLFWWPTSSKDIGWFTIVKLYSALAGSLSLVALQYFPRLRRQYWYLCLPPAILAINIAEAVVRDLQCYGFNGADPATGAVTWGGPWNIMNAIAGILNLLAISGWVGIFVSKKEPAKAIIWTDLTIWWIIGYDLWNFAYVYNCLADRSWYAGLALLASCTIPAFMRSGKGAWIQFRAYTLTLWSGAVLTLPVLRDDASSIAHRSAHNPQALFLVSALALAVNIGVFGWHAYRIITVRRNPFTAEVYADLPASQQIVADHAGEEARTLVKASV